MTLFKHVIKVFSLNCFYCILVLALYPISMSFAQNWKFDYRDLKSEGPLAWRKDQPQILSENSADKKAVKAKISGYFKKKNSGSLLINRVPIPVASSGSFSFLVPLEERDSQVEVTTVDRSGNIDKSRIVITYTPASPLAVKRPPTPSPTPTPSPVPPLKILFIPKPSPSPTPTSSQAIPARNNYSSTLGVGLSMINYDQTSLSTLREYALTGKINVAYTPFPSRWNFAGSIFFTGIPFGSSSADKVTLSFFGFNARVGYVVPWLRTPWRLNLMGGLYFTSANAKGGTELDANLGSSVSGVQFFPVLSRTFRRGDSVGLYFKLAPLANGFALSVSSAEYATGISYNFVPNRSGQGFGISVDASTMKLILGTLSVKSSSISFGSYYHF